MKKLFLIVVLAMLIALLTPAMVAGQDCCEFDVGTCCWRQCCDEIEQWYRVSWKEPVFLYFEEWDFGYWTSEYITEYVLAHNRDEAAESLGLRAGYDCFVGRAIGYSE